jgi:hypothetical protein
MDHSPEPADAAAVAALAPTDPTTLTEVLADYDAAGFTGAFDVTDTALVRCLTCMSESDPAVLDVLSLRRLEGASDPADMLSVLSLVCPSCESRGVLVSNYGPEASPQQAAVVQALRDERGAGELPGSQTPPEAAPRFPGR